MRGRVGCVLLLLCCAPESQAQVHRGRPRVGRATVLAGRLRPEPAASALRITHISLYKNGVGFFEHAGRVRGDAAVTLPLSSGQLNDVLASLTAIDLQGGHVLGANYRSTTPLAQQMENLPLSLGAEPTQGDLFTALRGARVEVSGAGAGFTGRVLAMEVRPGEPASSEDGREAPARRLLTLVADSGATRTVELGPRVTVRVLEPELRADLNSYLELLDRNRTDSLRHLTLLDRGTGERELRVSYLSEVPVWKSTYRVLLSPGANPERGAGGDLATVQGFSVIDNTTGEDWKEVRLSLIAGSPQSFLQPISQPLYDRRPEIPVAENAQTMPQTHESGEGGGAAQPTPPPGSASADLGSGAGGNPASLFGSPMGTGSGGLVAAPSRTPRSINMMRDTGLPAAPNMQPRAAAAPLPELYEQAAREALEARTTTAAWDGFFAYNLTDPVTIPRNGSALVPILQERLPVRSVTVWSARSAAPLRALWLTNSSALTLDAGSFAVVEKGAFAGQGLIDPVHPGERRLLSYAVDQAVHVAVGNSTEVHRVTQLKVAHGVLIASVSDVAAARYEVRNAAAASREVLVEVPRREGWTLGGTAKPEETTAGLYRFAVAVGAHGRAEISVTQRHLLEQQFALANSTEEQLQAYVLENGGNTAMLRQLQPVFDARQRVADLDLRVREVEGKVQSVDADQKRLRENLAVLKRSPEERALVRRYTAELQAQEDSLANLRRELEALRAQRVEAAAALAQRIETAEIG